MMVNYPNNPTVGMQFTLPSGIVMECVVGGDVPIWEPLPQSGPHSLSAFRMAPKANGDTLEWGKVNSISATGTLTMPVASSVDAEVFMELYFPSADAPRVITINRAGSDLFLQGSTTSTQYVLNISTSAESRYIKSNGTNRLVI